MKLHAAALMLATGAAAETPLFERLAPADSGIDFVNHGSPQRTNDKGEVIFFSTTSGKDTAGGVTIGDVDGDGLGGRLPHALQGRQPPLPQPRRLEVRRHHRKVRLRRRAVEHGL